MLIDRLKRISEHDSIILVGPNGAGKSRSLRQISEHLRNLGGYSVAISNTPYARLPDHTRKNYSHIKVNASTTNSVLRTVLFDALEEPDSFGLISMREVLAYTGYQPVLLIRITLREKVQRNQLFEDELDERDTEPPASPPRYEHFEESDPDIFRLAEAIDRVVGTFDIRLDNPHSFLFQYQDVVRAVRFQREINALLSANKRSIAINFSLIRSDGEEVNLSGASSGELTLLTTSMFVLSRRSELARVFIDEPENSLHPQWQVKYLEFLMSLLRREGIKFYFATHSAILTNGALGSDVPVRVIRCNGDQYEEIIVSKDDTDESIEQLLWEAFDTVTPASTYLSETISKLAWDVQEGTKPVGQALAIIDQYIEKTFSRQQREFLLACKKMISSLKRV